MPDMTDTITKEIEIVGAHNNLGKLLEQYAIASDTLESIRAELPQLAEAEKQIKELKEQIQDIVKKYNVEGAGGGFEVKLSYRDSWDTKKLPGFAVAHPELNELKSTTVVATIRRAKE